MPIELAVNFLILVIILFKEHMVTPVTVVACFLFTMFSLCSRIARKHLSLIPSYEKAWCLGRYFRRAL